MESSVVAAIVVADPFSVAVDVRGFGMAFAVVEMAVCIVVMIAFMAVAVIGLGAVVRNVSAADIVVAVVIAVVIMLRECG